MSTTSTRPTCEPTAPSQAPTSALHTRILDVMNCVAGPASTPQVRDCLNRSNTSRAVVIERVYAVLVALEHKGAVRRVCNATGTRPLWELTPIDGPTRTAESHMHCITSSTGPLDTTLTAGSLDERIARIDSPAHALTLAKVILRAHDTGTWQRWQPLAIAPLAGWLSTASRVDAAGSRIDWILRALAHRAQWSRAARRVADHQQLHDNLRSVSRLDDRQFADVGWMLILALYPWSSCLRPDPTTFAAGER
jgi:hypothetical protein